uniref:Putative nuclease n=1 Tax=viral metagenome TaxID=1070528 RepID=A0A6M3II44_9ZZZZ
MMAISALGEPEETEVIIRSEGIETVRMTLKEMRYGDYVWGDRESKSIGVERKTIMDLLGSIASGRLEEQLAGCLEEYDRVVLLKEGIAVPAIGDSIMLYEWSGSVFGPKSFRTVPPPLRKSYACLPALMFSLQSMGVDVMESYTARHSGYVLAAMYKNSQKLSHSVMKRYVRKKPILRERNVGLDVLLSVCRAGGVRLATGVAEEILKRWPRPMEALGHVEEWKEVRGVGGVTVEKLKEVL